MRTCHSLAWLWRAASAASSIRPRSTRAGRQVAAGWLRTLRATGEFVFSGCYSHRLLPGADRPSVHVAFPLESGNVQVFLRPRVLADGSLLLESPSGRFGEDGAYVVVEDGGSTYASRVPVHETFHVHLDDRDVLRGLAHSDPLTGTLNRRGFFAATEEWADKHPQRTLVAMDVDHFKQVNDRYGHLIGDAAIQQAGVVLFDAVSQVDGIVGRLGGDEFVCMLPLPLPEAMILIDQARVRIGISPVPSPIGPIALTCSFGLATWPRGTGIDEVLRLADTALYAAKAAGRNQIKQSDGKPAETLSQLLRSGRRN